LVSASSWALSPSWEEEACEHTAILDQVLVGDAEAAATLVRRHIEGFVARHLRRGDVAH
jgi:DNA-binding GntR family transcriptional regulator